MHKIVVGTDGSGASAPALRLAVDEARMRGAELEAVMAWDAPMMQFVDGTLVPPTADIDLEGAARATLAARVSALDSEGVSVTPSAVASDAASALLSAAADAELLVVGSRGHGGFTGLLLGSVSQKCVIHASCPIVVVPTGRNPITDGFSSRTPDLVADGGIRRVVVGVDGSESSSEALRWALEDASWRSVPVVVVLAWSYLDQHHPAGGPKFTPDYHEGEAKAALDGQLDGISIPTGLDVERRTPMDLPTLALLNTVRQDDLLVVGSRGRGGFTGLLLGSVSLQCVTHAPCAVAVVRSSRKPV